MSASFTKLFTHFVYSTKDRVPHLDEEVLRRLFGYIHGICRAYRCELVIGGGIADHVHLLILRRPDLSEAEVMRVVKSNSSRWIHKTYPQLRVFAWQDGYGAFSVSRSAVDDVRRYIENQAEHHRRRTFQEEFIELLRLHEIEYDPERIWA